MKMKFVSRLIKKLPLVFGSIFLTVVPAVAQTSTSLPTSNPGQSTLQVGTNQIIERGANNRVWQRVDHETLPSGKTVAHIHKYTELATGMHYRKNGQWVESKEEINILPDGTAAATQGQHQAYFPSDIAKGVIELDTPNGLKLQSRPIALSYADGGNTVLIAILTNSVGYLAGSNEVIYPNAFVGVEASLSYRYTKAGFEQNVVLEARPPTPESFGLNSQTARLQVITEFFNPPQPAVTSRILRTQTAMTLADQQLNFGAMQMIPGKAFLLGTNSSSVSVARQWLNVDGQQILLEELPFASIVNKLLQLPAPQAMSTKIRPNSPLHVVSAKRLLPPQHLPKSSPNKQPGMRIAKAALPTRGLVLDYQMVTSQSGYRFQGDETYYISGAVYLTGTNTFEAGAVIKYARNASLTIEPGMFQPKINWQANAYRPVIFTAVDDNSVGEAFGSGMPSDYYANPALNVFVTGGSPTISHFRILYAQQAIVWENMGSPSSISDGQIVNCQSGFTIYESSTYLRNILFSGVQTNFALWDAHVTDVQNSTFDTSSYLTTVGQCCQTVSTYFTNCLFINVSNLTNNTAFPYLTYTISGSHNGFYNSPNFGSATVTNSFYPFQTVGAGNYYLTNGCNFISAGTTNIDSTLLAELRTKTTHPPTVYFQMYLTNDITLNPHVVRDTQSSPDLGYHYDPLDYEFCGVFVTNCTVTINAGTAIAAFGTNGGLAYGFGLGGNSRFICQGSPEDLVRIVEYNTVQEEGSNSGWRTPWYGLVSDAFSHSSDNLIDCPFTEWSVAAQDAPFLNIYQTPLNLKDCQFHGGQLFTYSAFTMTNCLLDRVDVEVEQADVNIPVFRNNLFYGGTFDFATAVTNAIIKDNSFDQTAISGNLDDVGYDGGYNAFVTNYNRLPAFASDVILTNSLAYQSGPLGNYYQPTNSPLIHAGSTTADQVGLYNYTVTTNEVVEGTSIVSIGYHYVVAIVGPSDVTVTYGNDATFSVVVTASAPVHYQWQKIVGGVAQSVGGDSPSYTAVKPSVADTGARFDVIISSGTWSTTSPQATLTVNKAALSITASGQSKTYGQTLTFGSGSTQFTSSGLQNGETIGTVTLVCSGGAATTAVGSYPITPGAATGGTFAAANYNITYNNVSLTVSKATLTVPADNKIMGYGQTPPVLTYTINGFVNGENSSVVSGAPNLSTTAGSSSPSGSYPITITQGTLGAANYTFTYQNGTVTIQSVVTIAVTHTPASEIGLAPGTLTVSRTDQGAALTVNYVRDAASTANDTSDYQHLTGSVTISAGELNAPILVTPVLNANTGVGSKTVVLLLQGNPNYVLGASASATCTIIDTYGDTDSDTLADAMEAVFGGNPQTTNPGWKMDSDNDGLPDTYETMVGLNLNVAEPAPGLPTYSACPLR